MTGYNEKSVNTLTVGFHNAISTIIPVNTYVADIKLPPHLYFLSVFSLLSRNIAVCQGQSPLFVPLPNVTSGVSDPTRRPHLVSDDG